jgi:hypothetical protein
VIYYGQSFEDYANLPGLSPSSVKNAGISLHAWNYFRLHGREPTTQMHFGSATHCAILEPSKFNDRYVIWRGGRRAGKEWEAFDKDAEVNGKLVLTGDEQAEALHLQSVVLSHKVAGPLVRAIEQVEIGLTWETEDGIACKCRTDAINKFVEGGHNWFADLKTIRQLTQRSITSAICDFDYAMQMAANWLGWEANDQPRSGKLIFVETNPPYDVAVVPVSEEMLMVGKAMWERRIALIAAAKSEDKYPGVAWDDELHIDLPEWYVERNLELIGADNGN